MEEVKEASTLFVAGGDRGPEAAEVTGRRFRGVRRILHRLGKFQLQLSNSLCLRGDLLGLQIDNSTQLSNEIVLLRLERTSAIFSNLRSADFTRERLPFFLPLGADGIEGPHDRKRFVQWH